MNETVSEVAFRYPGESADRQEATEAVTIGTRLRQALLSRFPSVP